MGSGDADFVADARRGDAAAASVLLQRHRGRMHAVSLALLGPGADAADAVQDACLIALQRLDTLRDPELVGAWLCGITRNVCRQTMSSRWREVAKSEHLGELADADLDPAEILAARVTSDWLWTAIDGLSPPLRHAIVLRHFSRASSYDAVAAVLGVPVGTVRSRLSEARRTLTSSLLDLADARHGGHAELVAHRSDLFRAIYTEYNRGACCASFRSALTRDAELVAVGTGVVERGRDRIGDWLESDIELGVQVLLSEVIAADGITVVEGSFVNPVDLPGHCPAVTSHVYLHDGEGICAVRLHYGQAPAAA
jgi:RNA polymerase sigma-70 factor (ECF subfamily)